jgi:hypothetical protein
VSASTLFLAALGWDLPDWFSVIGFPLTLLGLYVGWRELMRTKDAAVAARDAVRDTQRQLADNHLLLVIPRLLQASRDLEHAVRRPDLEAAQKEMAQWRELAVQVRTLAERKGGERIALIEKIDRAIALIPPAEEALNDGGADPYERTRHARDRIRDAVDEATRIVTERMAFVEIERTSR